MISKKEQAEFLAEATPYIKKYNDKTRVIKYRGNAMIDEELKASVMRNLVLLQLVGMNVFVHGDVSKIECCNEAIRRGVQKVFITDGRVNHSILMELFSNDYGRNVC